jgi:excinuclease ABC subunit B
VMMFADKITPSMKRAIDETNRRRKIQLEYNEKHGIKPKSIVKPLQLEVFEEFMKKEEKEYPEIVENVLSLRETLSLEEYAAVLEEEMYRAASELRYEDAAIFRDELYRIKEKVRR